MPDRPTNDLLLRAARRLHTVRTPVWLMRQAGRYDPEYRRIRDRCGLALEQIFRNPELAAQITLLPVRFGVDAAIIFQDILTPLAPMGAPFQFRPGPVLARPMAGPSDLLALRLFDPRQELAFVRSTVDLVQRELGGRIPLIGFAGAPLTLAAYLIEGGQPGPRARRMRAMLADQPQVLEQLLERLAQMTVDYLAMLIDAGVHAVQLFESVADLVDLEQYARFAHRYHQFVFGRLPGTCPTILFVKERPWLDLMVQSGADVLSVGCCVDLAEANRRYGDRVAFQGNVDNRLLQAGGAAQIDQAVRRCVAAGHGIGHILNLNHGVLKETPVEHVQRFIEQAHSFRAASEPEAKVKP